MATTQNESKSEKMMTKSKITEKNDERWIEKKNNKNWLAKSLSISIANHDNCRYHKKKICIYVQSLIFSVWLGFYTLTSAFGVRCVSMVVIKIAWNETTSEIEQKRMLMTDRERERKKNSAHINTHIQFGHKIYTKV